MANFHPASNHIALQKWQPFLREHAWETVQARIRLLKSLCDRESSAHIDCFVDRVVSQPDVRLRDYFRIDFRSIAEMTRPESLQSVVQETPTLDTTRLREEYDLEDVDIDPKFIRPENFLFHSGLKLVPEAHSRLKGRCIVDGGAYRGESAAVFRKHYPECSVHAFEPAQENFKILDWMSRNTKFGQGITPVNMGISSESYTASTNTAGHGTSIQRDRQGDLSVTSLDDYARDTGVEIGCIKLDIEGVEKAAIEGARRIIERQRPILLISIYHTPTDFLDIAPMIDDWDLKYSFLVRHLHPQLTSFFGEFMLIAIPDY